MTAVLKLFTVVLLNLLSIPSSIYPIYTCIKGETGKTTAKLYTTFLSLHIIY